MIRRLIDKAFSRSPTLCRRGSKWFKIAPLIYVVTWIDLASFTCSLQFVLILLNASKDVVIRSQIDW
jgi:hypothetical protein